MNRQIASFRCDSGTLDWLDMLLVRISGSVRRKRVAPRAISTIKSNGPAHEMPNLCGSGECVGAAQKRNYRHSKLTPPSVADVDHPTTRCFDFLRPAQQSFGLFSTLSRVAVGSGVGHTLD